MKVFINGGGKNNTHEVEIYNEISIEKLLEFIEKSQWKIDMYESMKNTVIEEKGIDKNEYYEREMLIPNLKRIDMLFQRYDKEKVLRFDLIQACNISKPFDLLIEYFKIEGFKGNYNGALIPKINYDRAKAKIKKIKIIIK